ncbi:MAG: HYR domain-containing protein, partial [Chitinophagaceae bacterium]
MPIMTTHTSPGSKTGRFFKRSRLLVLTLLLLFVATAADASHFRYGNISWSWVSGRTVQFKVSQAYRRSFTAQYTNAVVGTVINVGSLTYSDASAASAINLVITSVNAAEDWIYGEAIITKTFTTDGIFTASFSSNARLSTLRNNADLSYRQEAKVTIGGIGLGNSGPASGMPPTVNLPFGRTAATFQLAATDPNGDVLTYRFATAAEMGGGIQPNTMTLNSTGRVTFNTTVTAGTTGNPTMAINNLYSAVFVVTDTKGATTMIDLIVKIVQASTPPVFDYAITPASGTVYDIQPGQTVAFSVRASDIDPGDQVASLVAVGLPTGVSLIPALPASGNPVNVNFSWTPNATQLGTRVISFTAQDNSGNQTTTTVNIIVGTNPVFNVPPTPVAGWTEVIVPGNTYSTTISASAPDPTVNVQIVSASGPAGISFSPALPSTAANTSSTSFSWTPAVSNWGKHPVVFTATDNLGKSKNHSMNLLVNTTPWFESANPNNVVLSENQPYTLNITVADPDLPYGDDMHLIPLNMPSWLTFTQTGPLTGVLSGTPGAGSSGTFAIGIIAEDRYHHDHLEIRQDFTITVNPCTLTASILPAQSTICSGAEVTLTASAGTSYTWSNGATGSSINVSPAATTTYDVTITDGFCSAQASATVMVNATPVLSAGSNGPVTAGGTINLSANGAATYTWSGPGGFSANTANASLSNASLAKAGTYTVVGKSAEGCSATASTLVSVSAVGPAGINAGILTWLDGSDIDADTNNGNDPATGAALGTWFDKSGNANNAVSLNGAGSFRSDASASINTRPVVRFSGGQNYNFSNIDIRAISKPDVTIITVYKQGNGGNTGLWGNDNGNWDRFMYTRYGGNNGIASRGPGQNPPNTTIVNSGVVGNVYLFTGIYDGNVVNGVNNGPVNGSSFYFNGSLLGTFTDRTETAAAQSTLRLGFDGDDGFFVGDVAEFIVYDRVLSACEIQEINSYLSVKYGITFSTAAITPAGTVGICDGGTTTLAASAGSAYQWKLDGVAINGATASSFVASTAGSYTVDVTSACGVATSAATIVAINPAPSASITYTGNATICPGTNKVFTATATAGSGTISAYRWMLNGNAINGASAATYAANATGSYTVEVTNSNGCKVVSAPVALSVSDNVAPVPNLATLPLITGECSASATAPSATDNCKGTLTATTTDPVSYSAQGTYTIHWTYNDGNGNTATQEQTVIVQDNTAPVFNAVNTTVPATILSRVPEAGQYSMVYQLNISADASWNNNTAPPYAVNNAAALAGKPFNRIAYYMELDNGQWVWVSMDKFTSNVALTGIPSVGNTFFQQRVNNMNVFASANAGVTTGSGITTGNIEFWNNCYGGQNTLGLPGARSAFYDYDDERSASQPSCYGSFQVHNWGAQQTLFAYNRWAQAGADDLGIGNNTGSSGHPDWTFQYNANTYANRKLYVFVSGGIQNLTANTDASGCTANVVVNTPSATDNCGTPVVTGARSDNAALNASYPKGVTTITWTATDAVGKQTTATQTVTVSDKTAPVPNVAALPIITGECSAAVSPPTATDNCAGLLTATTTFPTTYSAQGSYVITWTYTDADGNSTTQDQTVIIRDVTAPTISCPADVHSVATSAAGTTVAYDAPLVSDNCTGVVTTTLVEGLASGSVFPIGETRVTYKATDAVGRTSTCTFTVTVEGLPPVIECPENITVNNTPGLCGTNVSFAASETTAIPTSTITYSIAPGSFFPVGATVVTATATNAVGSSTCSFTITVQDTEAPVAPATLPVINGECSAVATAPTATDNCSGIITATTSDATSFSAQGTYSINWIYTDAAGNTTTQTQTVVVRDVTPPVIACAFNITVSAMPNSCGAVVNYNAPSATDNCGNGALPTSIDGYSYQGTFNGHTYFLSNDATNPEDAHARAIALGGHLVTISDANENAFVSAMSPSFIWIGHTDRENEGDFRWVTSEPVNYTNW